MPRDGSITPSDLSRQARCPTGHLGKVRAVGLLHVTKLIETLYHGRGQVSGTSGRPARQSRLGSRSIGLGNEGLTRQHLEVGH